MVAERDLEIEVMKEVARKTVGAPIRRRQVAYARTRGLSTRRACALVQVARSTWKYTAVRTAQDAPILRPMRELGRTGEYKPFEVEPSQLTITHKGFVDRLR